MLPGLRGGKRRARAGRRSLGAELSRDRGVERRLRDEAFREQVPAALQRFGRLPRFGVGLRDVRLRDLDAGARLVELRADVAVVEPRDDVVRLDAAALGDT